MIVVPVDRQALGELVALGGCPDCLGEVALIVDGLSPVGVAHGVRAAVVHSSESCPSVLALPLGAMFLVLPPGIPS